MKKEKGETLKNNEKILKFLRLKKRSIINSCLIFASFITLLVAIYGNHSVRNYFSGEVKQLDRKLNDVNSRTQYLKNRTKEAMQYVDKWKEIKEKTEYSDGIDMKYMQSFFDKLEKKHNVQNFNINLSTPVELGPEFQRGSISVFMSNVKVSFSTFSDNDAIAFVKSVQNELGGYVHVVKFNMKKTVQINDEYIYKLRSMGKVTSLDTALEFAWYAFKINENLKN